MNSAWIIICKSIAYPPTYWTTYLPISQLSIFSLHIRWMYFKDSKLSINIMFHFFHYHTEFIYHLKLLIILHILQWSLLPLFTIMVKNVLLENTKLGKYSNLFSLICSMNSLHSANNRCMSWKVKEYSNFQFNLSLIDNFIE